MWMDTDVFSTKPWPVDPIAVAVQNNLTILFDNYPAGGSRDMAVQIAKGFNVSLCQLKLTKEGQLESKFGTSKGDAVTDEYCNNARIQSVHGFFHVTNLDFYRSPQVTRGIDALFEDCFLCRNPDDQISVTIPAAVYTPERSWDMRRKGIQLDLYHNFRLDGKDSEKTFGFKQLWKLKRLRQSMKEARGICPVTERA
jgi:hypothetical protein